MQCHWNVDIHSFCHSLTLSFIHAPIHICWLVDWLTSCWLLCLLACLVGPLFGTFQIHQQWRRNVSVILWPHCWYTILNHGKQHINCATKTTHICWYLLFDHSCFHLSFVHCLYAFSLSLTSHIIQQYFGCRSSAPTPSTWRERKSEGLNVGHVWTGIIQVMTRKCTHSTPLHPHFRWSHSPLFPPTTSMFTPNKSSFVMFPIVGAL